MRGSRLKLESDLLSLSSFESPEAQMQQELQRRTKQQKCAVFR